MPRATGGGIRLKPTRSQSPEALSKAGQSTWFYDEPAKQCVGRSGAPEPRCCRDFSRDIRLAIGWCLRQPGFTLGLRRMGRALLDSTKIAIDLVFAARDLPIPLAGYSDNTS